MKIINKDLITFFKQNKEIIISNWLDVEIVKALLKKFNIKYKIFKESTATELIEYFIRIIEEKHAIGACPVIEKLLNVFFEKNFNATDIFALCNSFKDIITFLMIDNSINKDVMRKFYKIQDQNLQNTLSLYTYKMSKQNELLKTQRDIIEDHVLLTTTNEKGIITHTTDAFCKLSGYSKDELVGKSHRIMRDPTVPQKYYKDLWDTILQGKSWESNVRNITKNGILFIVRTKIVAVKDKEGTIVQYMAIRDDITAKENAKYDSLTKLYNRKQFDNKFKNLFEEAIYNSTSLCFIIADADHFKYVNDNYGHKKGDEVLIEISKILSDNTRDDDLCARWGGEEFAIVLIESNIDIAKKIANRMRKSISSNIFIGDKPQTCSFGISTLSKTDTIESLFNRADKALYKAKNNGRNRVEFL
jgi:diguanylate cyclase (GGDEF)-like protein/PAS domain S-box-containing protein